MPLPVCRAEKPVENRSPLGRRKYVLQFLSGSIDLFINMLGNEALATRTYVVNIVMFVYLFAIAMAQGGAICIGHLVGERKFMQPIC